MTERSAEIRSQKSKVRGWSAAIGWLICLSLGIPAVAASARDLASLCTDRTAVERIYYEHRLGNKPPFEKAQPAAEIEKIVKLDLKKEAVLKRVYKIGVTPAEVAEEVQRINSSTRAPDVLAEIKAALDQDPTRFAQTMARPLVVERKLRAQF